MRQIKDMLTKESSETAEMNNKIEKILAVIEDLRKDITSNTGPEASSDGHHPKHTTKTTTKSTPHKPAVAKIEETPTIQHET